MEQIGFGGSCHWCTEAVFQSANGVLEVRQGWICSDPPEANYAEAVWVFFDPAIVKMEDLIQIHLHTHSCTANHNMRAKYRSAIYIFNPLQKENTHKSLRYLQKDFELPIITVVLPFVDFTSSLPASLNYYYSNPQKPFCKMYIDPKLKLLLDRFPGKIRVEKLRSILVVK